MEGDKLGTVQIMRNAFEKALKSSGLNLTTHNNYLMQNSNWCRRCFWWKRNCQSTISKTIRTNIQPKHGVVIQWSYIKKL